MSEEIIYSNLKFQDSNKIENTQNLQNLGKKVYKTLKLERKKLNKLQNVKEELQRNVSLQLMDNVRSSEEIRNLSITLQIVATELCRELDRKKPEHKCKPCPKGWIWNEDICHIWFSDSKTWQNAEILCSAHNASLLQVKNKKKLELIKSLKLYNYWLGLSPSNNMNFKTLDDMITSSAWLKRNISDLNEKFCGFIHGSYVYYTYCSAKKYTFCEKMANSVNI
uniref:C-type lectin domain family 12 member A n=1 Tax=Sciurus vulgaris TaxID=55149 RepID=A0A8D2AR57_SCIVU